MALCMLTFILVVSGVATVEQDWQQALDFFGLQRPPRVTPVNFYRSLGAVDFVSPGTTVTINPLRLPQIPLRAICSHWHDFSNTGPNWRMVWVHDARKLAGNPLLQYPTYMVMKRGVDALLDRRPHGLVELLSFIPDRVNVFFFARCCLGKVPGGAPFSQLHKGIGSITRTGQHMQLYKPKQIQTKQRQQQIPNCGGREDETDARAVRPNSLARCIE